MNLALVIEPLVIAALVVLQVGLWQFRLALSARRAKRPAALLASLDAVLWVTVLGQVLTHLDRLGNVIGYALGVAAGVYLGCLADERSAQDVLEYRLIVPGAENGVVEGLRACGWPATAQPAAGLAGPATVVLVIVDAGLAARLEADLVDLAPATFWTCTRLRSATSVALPPGYLSLRPRRGHRRRLAISGRHRTGRPGPANRPAVEGAVAPSGRPARPQRETESPTGRSGALRGARAAGGQ